MQFAYKVCNVSITISYQQSTIVLVYSLYIFKGKGFFIVENHKAMLENVSTLLLSALVQCTEQY